MKVSETVITLEDTIEPTTILGSMRGGNFIPEMGTRLWLGPYLARQQYRVANIHTVCFGATSEEDPGLKSETARVYIVVEPV